MEAVQTRRKQEHQLAKKAASCALYDARRQAQSEYFREINTHNDRNKIFKMAQVIKGTHKDITREKCVRDDMENLILSDDAKLRA